jgi:hypothetical protein
VGKGVLALRGAFAWSAEGLGIDSGLLGWYAVGVLSASNAKKWVYLEIMQTDAGIERLNDAC